MTFTRKLLSVLLCVALVASLALFAAGCNTESGKTDGGSTDGGTTTTTTAPPAPTDEELIVGSWKGTYDITEAINGLFADDETMGELVKFEDLSLAVTLTFNEDGTFTMVGDEASITAFVESFKSGMRGFLVKMYDELAIAMEYESADAMFAEMGTTAEETIDQAMELGFSDETVKEMTSSFAGKGTYELEDGKLFTANEGEEINKESYQTYELTADTLKLLTVVDNTTPTDVEGDEEASMTIDPSTVYPVTFEKVK